MKQVTLAIKKNGRVISTDDDGYDIRVPETQKLVETMSSVGFSVDGFQNIKINGTTERVDNVKNSTLEQIVEKYGTANDYDVFVEFVNKVEAGI